MLGKIYMRYKIPLGICSGILFICGLCFACCMSFFAIGAISNSSSTTSELNFNAQSVSEFTQFEGDGFVVDIHEDFEQRDKKVEDKFIFFDHKRRDGYYFFVGTETKTFPGAPSEETCNVVSRAISNPDVDVLDVDAIDYGPIYGCYFQTEDSDNFIIDNYYVTSSNNVEGEDAKFYFYGASYKTIGDTTLLSDIQTMLKSFEVLE